MKHILRFTWVMVRPTVQFLAIPFLLVALLLVGIVYGVTRVWIDTKPKEEKTENGT